MATNVRGPLCFVNVGLLHPGVPAQPGRGPSRATAGASVGPASSPPPAGPSLVPCLSRVQTEVLTGMSAEQKRWSGGAGGKARTRGARARAGGRGAQAGRGSTEGFGGASELHFRQLPAQLPGRAVRTAGARVLGARTAPRGFPVSLELPESVADLHTASPGGATDATSSGPPDRTRWRSAALRGASSRPRGPARLRQLLASEALRHGEGHHSLSWP